MSARPGDGTTIVCTCTPIAITPACRHGHAEVLSALSIARAGGGISRRLRGPLSYQARFWHGGGAPAAQRHNGARRPRADRSRPRLRLSRPAWPVRHTVPLGRRWKSIEEFFFTAASTATRRLFWASACWWWDLAIRAERLRSIWWRPASMWRWQFAARFRFCRATCLFAVAVTTSARTRVSICCTSSPGVPMWRDSAAENGLLAPSPSNATPQAAACHSLIARCETAQFRKPPPSAISTSVESSSRIHGPHGSRCAAQPRSSP
jgi:hypothetical protein